MSTASSIRRVFSLLIFLSLFSIVAFSQATSGVVRGTVTDPNGAVVPNAKVTISQSTTNTSQTAQTGESGDFQFSNLLVGEYTVTVEAANFKKLTLNQVRVQLNQPTDLNAQLTVGLTGEVVEVTAAGTELVDTTTANVTSSYSGRQTVDLAQTGGVGGINNLALLSAGVSSSGGVGVGTGGSVGGQRPRNNNFVLDGIDNNDKSVTGPQSYISPEEVAEFSLQQNQFSAEYARSNGGQFITVTKSGTNEYHGSLYGFLQNKKFNALEAVNNIPREQQDRFDRFRGGFNIGGPMPGIFFSNPKNGLRSVSDKVFFFTSYERLQQGAAAAPLGIQAPTALGRTLISATPGLSATNVGVLFGFLPVAASQEGFIVFGTLPPGTVCTTPNANCIPVGTVRFAAPSFFKQNHVVANIDYNQSSDTSQRFRFTLTNLANIDNAANLPQFYFQIPNKQRLFSYTLAHNFSSNLINETRLAYRRSSNNFNVPDITFPGLSVFPNITLDDLGVNIGPNPNAPQTTIENNYQIVNNVTYLRGKHTMKFGGDFRIIIAPQTFTQRVRGDYEYGRTERFLRDQSPEVFGERSAGNVVYYGNQKILYAFAQDDWRIRPNLTLNLGVNYSYQQVPLGARTSQALNSISTVPGLLEFREPKSQKRNFGPRLGFAWSPNYDGGILGRLFGDNNKTSIRAGFSMGYDYIFDNLYILSGSPQLQQTNNCPGAVCPTTNFLASGGLPDTPVAITDAATARANTAAFIPDQKVPYSLTYTFSIQRQLAQDLSLELRYLGTRGVHLLTQNRINRQAKVSPEDGRPGLPTFFAAPSQATLNALTLSLDDITARSNYVPAFENAGFNGASVVAFLSNGNSSYHGGSAQLTKRFSRGLQMTAAYTLSHLIDDTTAEVFSTILSPRRVEDFQNLRRERANSALDHRHRFVVSAIYELPWFRNGNSFAKTLLGGFSIAGTYTYESGEFVTIRSGNDSNLNGDNAGDRAIFNPAGTEGVGSEVTALCRLINPCTRDADGNITGTVVGYLVNNPNARYIQAGDGAFSNLGRNTFRSPAINNVDISVFKNFRTGENSFIQFRVDMYNALNHAQFVPGAVNDVSPTAVTGATQYNQIFPLTSDFLKADRVFSSHPRVIQMALRWNF